MLGQSNKKGKKKKRMSLKNKCTKRSGKEKEKKGYKLTIKKRICRCTL